MRDHTAQIASQAPTTYQEWLSCFDSMKNSMNPSDETFAAARKGNFTGSELTKSALQKQIVETVNAVLDRSIKRFVRHLNENIIFNDFLQTELLFKRLKKDINKVLFFEGLAFLPRSFRCELGESVKEQMSKFWNDTLSYLSEQSIELSHAELEDVLFLVKRINLFE
jgi:hypothetical protein